MFDESLKAILRSNYAKKKFFLGYGCILVLLIMLLSISLNIQNCTWRETFSSFFSNFASTVAVFIVTYGFYCYISPPGLRTTEIVCLKSGEISESIFTSLQPEATNYWFWGRSGSYFRTTIFPLLNSTSAKDRRHIHIAVVLPDPFIEENAHRYAILRQSLDEKCDKDDLLISVLALLVILIRASLKNPYLQIRVGFSSTVPVIRYDISNLGAVITRDSKDLPAILVNSGNPYFETFKDAVENELAQSKKITWNSEVLDSLNEDSITVSKIFDSILNFPKVEISMILEIEKNIKNPKSHRYV